MHTIELANGVIISAELNGNNFIPEVLDKDVFVGNLETVTIADNEGNMETRTNQKVQFAKIGDVDTFVLLDKSQDEVEKEVLMLALVQLDAQREIDKTEANLALAELAGMLLGGNV